MTDTKTLPRMISTRTAATLAGVSQRTVTRWADAGKLGRVSRVDMGDNRPGMLLVSRSKVEKMAEALKAERAAAEVSA